MATEEEQDSNSSPMTGVTTTLRVKKYPSDAKGPYTVFIRKKDEPMDQLVIQKYVFSHYKTCNKAFSVNEFKLKFEFTNLKDANDVVEDENLDKYKVYVPADSVEVRGIINLPVSCTENAVLVGVGKFCNPNLPTVPILEVYRLTKGENKEPISRIKVTFSGSCLPDYVLLDGHFLIKVQPFFQKTFFCEKCLEYGHSIAYCTRYRQKCRNCAGNHVQTECTSATLVCKHCKGEHLTGSKICPTAKKVQQRSDKTYQIKIQNRYSELNSLFEEERENEQETAGPSQTVTQVLSQTLQRSRKRPSVQPSSKSQPPSKKDNRSYANVVSQSTTLQNPTKTGATSNQNSNPTSEPRKTNFENCSFLFKFVENLINKLDISPAFKEIILQFLSPILENLWSQFSSTVLGNLTTLTQNV